MLEMMEWLMQNLCETYNLPKIHEIMSKQLKQTILNITHKTTNLCILKTTNRITNKQIKGRDNQRGSPRQSNQTKRKFTPLGEPLEVIMHKLFQTNLIKLPDKTTYDEPNCKPPSYNENDQCKFHKIKGYMTNNCMRLKNIIQDLIEKGKVDIEHHPGSSRNRDMGIYKDPIPNHSRGNDKGKGQDY